jgi:hypothetical protein
MLPDAVDCFVLYKAPPFVTILLVGILSSTANGADLYPRLTNGARGNGGTGDRTALPYQTVGNISYFNPIL